MVTASVKAAFEVTEAMSVVFAGEVEVGRARRRPPVTEATIFLFRITKTGF